MKKPDTLLVEIEKSIFMKAIVISLIAHALLLGLTSFSLFADWTKYGVHSPSYINGQKAEENKRREAEERKAAAEKKAAEEQAKAQAAATNQTASVEGKGAAKKNAAPENATPAAEEGGKVTPPEVEALPPKKEFQLGDDLSLD